MSAQRQVRADYSGAAPEVNAVWPDLNAATKHMDTPAARGSNQLLTAKGFRLIVIGATAPAEQCCECKTEYVIPVRNRAGKTVPQWCKRVLDLWA
jgi:hypothetical protein